MQRVFDAVVDRTRSRLDVATVRTLFGAQTCPHRDRAGGPLWFAPDFAIGGELESSSIRGSPRSVEDDLMMTITIAEPTVGLDAPSAL
jgi:hypothetical protein